MGSEGGDESGEGTMGEWVLGEKLVGGGWWGDEEAIGTGREAEEDDCLVDEEKESG